MKAVAGLCPAPAVLVACAASLLVLTAQAQYGTHTEDPRPPQVVESSAWQEAVKRDDEASYERFLQQYPQTRFLPALTAAVQRLRQVDQAFDGLVLNRFTDTARLGQLPRLQAQSSSVGPAMGTRLLGPGVVVGGTRSARQHMLLPQGEWIPIASLDHELSGHATLRLASVAFAKFDGQRLQELMLVTFNREAPPAQIQSAGIYATPTWPPMDLCEARHGPADYHLKDSDMRSRWCALVRAASPGLSGLEPAELALRAQAALVHLQVALPSFKHHAETHVTNASRYFMSYTHLYGDGSERARLVADIGESDVALDPKLDAQTRAHYLHQAHYAYHAAVAFGHHYPALELQPETRLRGSTVMRTLGKPQ